MTFNIKKQHSSLGCKSLRKDFAFITNISFKHCQQPLCIPRTHP